MILISRLLVGFVALQHLGFMILEMALWTHPIGLKVFKQSLEVAEQSQVLAANQGLYNGFLAAGLIWSLLSGDKARPRTRFFLICVIVAGLFGGLTATISILFVQALPGGIALLCTELTGKTRTKEEGEAS